ncbi:MAG: site-specific integrase [Nitrososphaerota archaeon]|nr:site-specific integrase [Nitrososphaerota archaeon]MDG7023395.1 site-specific integrase [Nitrososphaerota archaeon]
MPAGSKYRHLLEDKDVRRWYENLEAKSVITATVYLRTLGLYCDLEKTTPEKILAEGPSKRFRDAFTDFIRRMEKDGKAGSYVERFKKVVISWTSYNNLDVKLKVNIKGSSETPTIADERVPSKDELSRILRMASPRGRVSIAMIAFSGLRPESLGDYLGTDGIRLEDFREAKISSGRIEFEKVPSILLVRRALSKARHPYFTFVGNEAITYIQEYLQERVKQGGEKLTPQSPLLAFDPRGVRKNRFLRTTLVTRDIKEAIVKAGFSWRPYVLRAYCDTGMIVAESKGYISHPYLQFLMGHKGDIEARYSTNKGRLAPTMIEEMREAYGKCEPLLSTKAESATEEQIKKTFKEQFLLVAGFQKEEMEKMKLDEMSNEELQSLVRQKLTGMMANNGSRQKVIPIQEVRSYIGQGYEYVASLPDGGAIVKVPF